MMTSLRTIAFAFLLTMAAGAAPSWANDMSWNGTWIGNWSNGDGAQIIFAGNEFIGFYWRGDYLSDAHATLSTAGVATITWPSGNATLTRDGETTAHIAIYEAGNMHEAFALKRES
jgi:hypothetical protein